MKSTYRTQQGGRERGNAGNGLGAHHEVSPMGHATTTKTRKGKRRAEDKRQKQRGWAELP